MPINFLPRLFASFGAIVVEYCVGNIQRLCTWIYAIVRNLWYCLLCYYLHMNALNLRWPYVPVPVFPLRFVVFRSIIVTDSGFLSRIALNFRKVLVEMQSWLLLINPSPCFNEPGLWWKFWHKWIRLATLVNR